MKTFEDLKSKIKGLYAESATFSQFIEKRDYFINEKTEVMAILNSMTLKELKKYYNGWSNDKKDRAVGSVYDSLLDYFLMQNSVQYSPMSGETYADALKKIFDSQTEEKYNSYKAKKLEEKKALMKAIENPETLEEFRTFVMYKGEAALTSEQKAVFDSLRADRIQEQKKRTDEHRATVSAVATTAAMEMKESKHTKTGEALYVVQLSERVDRDKFNELNNKAKKIGGYYSSYAKGGAIPGFTFRDKKEAEMFMNLKNGDVNTHGIKEEKKQERTSTRAEALKERAQQIEDKANEELSRERKDNTHRRARMAANAEAAALGNIEFAKTLRKIAEGIESGIIKYLGGIQTVTELEQIETALHLAKWAHVRADKINTERDGYTYSIKTAEFIKMPFPILYKSNVLHLLEKMKNDKGKKLAANRMIKRLNATKEDFLEIKGEVAIEDYKTLFCYISASISSWEVKSYRNRLTEFDRIQRIGLTTIEELRAAARELIEIKADAKPSAEILRAQKIKEAERKYLGIKLNGFFPTPSELAGKLVKAAKIEEGHTVLEPSAGLGHIAEAIAEAHPDNQLICIEENPGLCDILKMKDFEVKQQDFLTFNGGIFYDRIIMNPPFENLQDIDHVKHAFKLLKPGGRLVAIVANNKKGEREKCREFMELVDKYGTIEQNEPGAFESAFNPTSVNTCTVILDKP